MSADNVFGGALQRNSVMQRSGLTHLWLEQYILGPLCLIETVLDSCAACLQVTLPFQARTCALLGKHGLVVQLRLSAWFG